MPNNVVLLMELAKVKLKIIAKYWIDWKSENIINIQTQFEAINLPEALFKKRKIIN